MDYLISECEEEEAEDSDFNIEHLVEEELSEEDSDEEEEVKKIYISTFQTNKIEVNTLNLII